MLAMPIARREMLVLARSPALYRSRVSFSIVVLVFASIFVLAYERFGLRSPAQFGLVLHSIVPMICLFVGAQLTADSISSEKREGTIGLLFASGLTAFEIVLGKLVAHALTGFYWLALMFPMLSLLLIAGGIGGPNLLDLGLRGFNTMFVSAAAGLLGSARHSDRKGASTFGMLAVVFLWWGIPILAALALHYFGPGWVYVVGLFSLGPAVPAGAGPVTNPFESGRLWNLLVTHALGWLMVGLAARSLARNWQGTPPRARLSWGDRWRQFALGSGVKRIERRRRLLSTNAFLWLAARDRLRPMTIWVFTLLFLAGFGWSIVQNPAIETLCMMGLIVGTLQKVLFCGASGHQIVTELEQGTLQLLVATPLAARGVLEGQYRAATWVHRGPVVLVLGLQLLAAGIAFWTDPTSYAWPIGMVAFTLVSLLELHAACWLGMWGATIAKQANQAAGIAIGRLILLPGLCFGLIAAGANWFASLFGGPPPVPGWAWPFLWLFLSAANALFWLRRVQKPIAEKLATKAMSRYLPDEELTFWGRLGRWAGRIFRPPSPPGPPGLQENRS